MIRAIPFPDFEKFREKRVAGSIHLGAPDDLGWISFWFVCPCGCGGVVAINAGVGHKPAPSPSWTWNGSQTEATLYPSVNRIDCGWHGWLRDGYWEAV
ncbi:MAG: hypothetical protein EP318_06210 [Rhodobacteraceae bacterium]|nr:MAG: hypothetical protein EP318_06210 [Paracoccaceae bacterium]